MKRHLAVIMVVLLGLVSQAFVGSSGFGESSEPTRLGYCFDVAVSEDGNILYVAGGARGTYVLRVVQRELKFVRTIEPRGGYHRNIKVSGNYAYMADATKGLVVLDISTPDSPSPVFTGIPGDGMGIFVSGNRAYLASGGAGLKIIDVSDPTCPSLLGVADTPGSAWDVWVMGEYAYVADLKKGMAIINVASPAAPRHIGQTTWTSKDNMAEIIRGSGSLLHIGAGKHGLVTIDISDPQNPQVKDTFKSGPEGFGEGLAVEGTTVYLANGNKSDRSQNGLYIIDASDPDDLKIVGMKAFARWLEGVLKSGNHVFVANTYFGVRMFDFSDPSSPRETFHWRGRPRPPRP